MQHHDTATNKLFLKLFLAAWLGLELMTWPACGQGQSVSSVLPVPGSVVSNLTSVTVTFTKPVIGVHAEDLILNGSSGTNLAGSGAVYTFNFSPLAAGVIEASWNGAHNITDLSGNRLNDLGANTLWEYSLIDTVPPTVIAINPLPGATLSHLTQIAVTFSEPVAGVDASELIVNGQPASQVSGDGAGPYTFSFAAPLPGPVQLSWSANAGIHDLAPSANAFAGGEWSYALHPGEFSGSVVINEFLAGNLSTNGLRDEDGSLESWIELYNRGVTAVEWGLVDATVPRNAFAAEIKRRATEAAAMSKRPSAWAVAFPGRDAGPGAVFVGVRFRQRSKSDKRRQSPHQLQARYLGPIPRVVQCEFPPRNRHAIPARLSRAKPEHFLWFVQ